MATCCGRHRSYLRWNKWRPSLTWHKHIMELRLHYNNYSTITFTNNVNVACTGDIRTLLDWKNYSTVNTQNAKFCYLFDGCSVLTSAHKLPATKLADDCYYCMFWLYKSHVCPSLNATTLADGCYSSMFYGCTSLTSAPELNATTLVSHCYTYMFESCTSLTSAQN